MFFKVVQFFVIASLSLTCALNAATPAAAAAPCTEAAAVAPKRSDFDQFLDALDFGNYKTWESQYKAQDWHRPEGFSFMSIEWCINNAACGSPLLIKKFKALNTDLDEDQKDILTFLADVAENGKPKHTAVTMLHNEPPLLFQGNGCFSHFVQNPFAFSTRILPHDLIYKILFYTGYYTEAFNHIESRNLKIENPLEKQVTLLRLIGTPHAKNNYANMLKNNKISLSYDGKKTYTTDQERYKEAARLYRETNIPHAKHNYALMLETKKISLSYDGKKTYTTDQERYQEVARLYREVNTPETKSNLLTMIIVHQGYRETVSGETLADDHSAYQYVIDTITDSSYKKTSMSDKILAFTYEKIGNLEEAFKIREAAETLGDIQVDTDEEAVNSSESDEEEGKSEAVQPASPTSQQHERAAEKKAKDDKKRRQEDSKAAKAKHDASKVAREFDTSEEDMAKVRAEALRDWKAQIAAETPEKKAKRHAKTQEMLTASCGKEGKHNFHDYKLEFENGAEIAQVPDTYRKKFTHLIQGIKEKNGEGKPHMLSGDYFGFKLIARSITHGDRIVYYFDHVQKQIVVVQCKGHYDDT